MIQLLLIPMQVFAGWDVTHKCVHDMSQSENLASQLQDNGSKYFTPYWNTDLKHGWYTVLGSKLQRATLPYDAFLEFSMPWQGGGHILV